MAITQLSAFLENKPGQLAAAVKALSDGGVNIRAMSIADTKEFGILRLIVSDAAKGKELLGTKCIVTDTRVIAVPMDDVAGALSTVLQVLDGVRINVEYMYAFTGSAAASAYVVLRVEDVSHAEDALKAAGVKTLTDEELSKLL